MLTVKHVIDGQEHIYEAPFGAMYTGPNSRTGCGGPHISLPKAESSGVYGTECKMLHRGHAYVMNDNGATIGAYSLGEPPLSVADSSAGALA